MATIEHIAKTHSLSAETCRAGHVYLYGTPENCKASLKTFERHRHFPQAILSSTVDGVPVEGFRPHVFFHTQAVKRAA